MESSVTDIIAELVMQNVEEKALERSPVKSKWCRDLNACIKRDSVEVLHNHFNSINTNI